MSRRPTAATAPAPRDSTPELLSLERDLMEAAERRRGEGGVAPKSRGRGAIEARPTLSEEQARDGRRRAEDSAHRRSGGLYARLAEDLR